MSFLDRLLGRTPAAPAAARPAAAAPASSAGLTPADAEEQAIARYQYLVRTAPPEDIERAHAEAFASLTPAQRHDMLVALSDAVPASERATTDDPASLARMATRAEMRQPGTLERTFAGPGMGTMFMSTLAGAFIGTAVAQSLFGGLSADGNAVDGASASDGTAADGSNGQADAADGGNWDGGGDTGSYGGGDVGGLGDFGGGDFGGDF